MNADSTLVDALQATALLAAEIAILVLIAAALEPLIKSAVWRRTLWQACILTVTLIPVMELSGISREATRFAFAIKQRSRENKTPLVSTAPAPKPELHTTPL